MCSFHAKVRNVALVSIADERLGELGCACIVLEPGQTLLLEELRVFLTSSVPGAISTASAPAMTSSDDNGQQTSSSATQTSAPHRTTIRTTIRAPQGGARPRSPGICQCIFKTGIAGSTYPFLRPRC
jgi:acyl-CoA synthetase (AMP-forming)/AMP-acid ligase II